MTIRRTGTTVRSGFATRFGSPTRGRALPPRRSLVAVTALLAALALVGAACGGGDDSADGDGDGGGSPDGVDCPVDALEDADGPVEVVLWHGVVGLAARTLDEFAQEYNASQDKVTVRVESQGDYNEQLTKYTAALRDPDNLPGILLGQETNTQFVIDSQSAIPADACIAADPDAGDVYDQLMPSVKAAYSVDDVMWPGSFGVSTLVLYYNRAHFEQAGLDPDDPPGTLEEMRSVAEALEASNPERDPFIYRADSTWMEQLDTRQGDAVVNQDNGRDGLADESLMLNDSTTEWTSWLEQMTADGLMDTVAYSATFDAYLAVATESASMLVETSTAATTVDALISGTLDPENVGLETGTDLSGLAFPNLDAGVGQMPGFTEPGSGTVGGNAWFLVGAGKSPEQIAGAWDFMKWVNDGPNQAKWTTQGSYLPVFSGAAEDPSVKAYFADTRAGGWLATAFESFGSVDADFPGPIIGPYAEFRSTLRSAIEASLIGGADITAEFEKANTAIQAALDDYALEVGG